jgi:hypothetical protein
MLFLTQCKKNGESYEGPVIEAESWEQARAYALQIQSLENQTGRGFNDLEILGEAVTRVSNVKCGSCGKEWVAVYPVEAKSLFCPKCYLRVPLD